MFYPVCTSDPAQKPNGLCMSMDLAPWHKIKSDAAYIKTIMFSFDQPKSQMIEVIRWLLCLPVAHTSCMINFFLETHFTKNS